MTIEIVVVTPANHAVFAAHISRHFLESGKDGYWFMPFYPDDPKPPGGIHVEKLDIPLHEPNWHRGFMAIDTTSGEAVGHVDLKGLQLRTMRHRCELGLGVEEAWRGRGLGRQLLQTAIDFCRACPHLVWLDLCTFGSNLPAQSLYRKMGFEQYCVVRDRFRIGELQVDDIGMSLRLR